MEATAMKGFNALIVLTALTVAGGCAGGPAPAAAPPASSPPTSSLPAGSLPTGSPPTGSSPAKPAGVTAIDWATTPTTVPHSPAVPPVPVLTGIRYASHDGFDRIVLDIPGALPGYSVKYVPQVVQDGSGNPVSLPGKAFLLITLHPAQAHRENGTPTVSGTHRTGLPVIQAYTIAGDYEGYVSIGLGLDGVRKY